MKALLPVVAAAAILAACTGGQTDLTAQPTTEPTTTTTEPSTTTTTLPTTTLPTTTTTEPTTTTTVDPAEVLLAQLSLEEKIGQMLMPVVAGTSAEGGGSNQSSPAGQVVVDHHVGGVIYLGNNIVDAPQLTALSAGLQERAIADSGIGLLIAVDQEGGRVVRIRDGVTVLPSARSYEGDTERAGADATQSGTELQLQGINMVLAPVAGVTDSTTSVIGNRSYSGDAAVASAMVTAVIDGYRAAGISSVVKHWPGHGPTEVDSHRSLPTLDISIEQWHAVDRLPFEAAIAADVDAVMVGHLAFPALDPSGDPATISAPMIEGELRSVLGFDGVVMTDALDMGAVDALGSGELAIRSVQAGVDLLLAPLDLAEASAALIAAVDDGTLTEERIDESVLRLLRLKLQLGLIPSPGEPAPETTTESTSTTPTTATTATTAAGASDE